MQTSKAKVEVLGRKAKLATSYQELLDDFSNRDLKNVGNYSLGKLIGKGSFGKVYLAHHKLTNGSKVVLKSANKDDSNLAREIHHHRQFVHPHIARLYEVIVTESLVWLVLEYCPGDELYNYLLKHGPLPVGKVQKTFTQLVGAVSYVHQQSCVHRDLKLENILLDKHENVKLVDFGFTREYEGKSNYLQTFCGTICYSAPEMLKGEKYAGEKVDVWSLGVILYALLCGELPFDDDDDNVTRTKILSEEPKYRDHLPADAIALIKLLLSKRPLLRPSLPEILSHPFLAEYAPQQQAILKLHQPPPFATALEKDCLQRMRSAGVDIDAVIESVLAQKCDALAGWWTLLLEKEERKARRRERRRKEKEAENRNSRRFSAASGKLERMAPILDGTPNGYESKEKGLFPDGAIPPLPIDKASVRSVSSSRNRRPLPPPKEGILRSARSRGSTLHLVTTTDALDSHGGREQSVPQKVRKNPSQAIVATWKNWTHWIVENTRRHRPNKRGSLSTPNLVTKDGQSERHPAKIHVTKTIRQFSLMGPLECQMRLSSSASYKRQSLSPVPLTPRSTMRRSSTGLRGRKSTSSSLSSIRTMPHHHHTHSKASSTSSNGSVSTTKTPGRSPHHSVKVLPATPTTSSFPSNIRLVRGPALALNFNEGMPAAEHHNPPGSPNPFSGGSPSVLFAKRKRNLFKGPSLSIHHSSSTGRGGTSSGNHSRSASTSGLGRRSGEITIQEEDEEALEFEGEEEVEEVDQFSPVLRRPGEKVEEIYETIAEGEGESRDGKGEDEAKEVGTVSLLILGAGWTSTFLIPLLKREGIKHAATTTNGRNGTIPFRFDPCSDDNSPFEALPAAKTVLITFPLKGEGQAARLVSAYAATHPGAQEVRYIQLGV
ncbi:hypothetical protein EKO27_g5650, partial [Xylaria grammica]